MAKAPHPYLSAIGKTVRSIRRQQGLSQEALADRAHIDRSYMSGIERGLRNISVLHVARIAGALRVSVAELLQPRGYTGVMDADAMARFAAAESELSASVTRPGVADSTPEWEPGRYLSIG